MFIYEYDLKDVNMFTEQKQNACYFNVVEL